MTGFPGGWNSAAVLVDGRVERTARRPDVEPRLRAEARAETYGVSPGPRERGLVRHRLGPWYEVTHGPATGDGAMRGEGPAGVLERLTAAAG
ncbi:hypothetical protein GCM10009678_20650 [Actinomadura kijaniata]|uniref:Uncharacterized protein n=1 Tax=Actinomadura namibiensis TaxID=182080 RepID=A0A7W3QJ93_ACTNM|nr:hypothetical protein [Actinomadura namibiensis]MBA8949047.1 hypothetical protein [Actinomadura namibiensis]